MKARERRGEWFVVSGQAAEPGRPGKGALDHPASGPEDKPAFGFFEFDDFEAHPVGRRLLSGVTLVDQGGKSLGIILQGQPARTL